MVCVPGSGAEPEIGNGKCGDVWYAVWVENLGIWGERIVVPRWLGSHRPPVKFTSNVWKVTRAIRE